MTEPSWFVPTSVQELAERLEEVGYFADRDLATALFLALRLRRPLFLEGEAGVGKTEAAKALARLVGSRLIRLQCYEGLDVHSALYEWDHARQLLHIRLAEAGRSADEGGGARTARAADLYRREFLLRRPLLEAVEAAAEGLRPVLLIDELDRADEEFEAFLLELLSEFQVSIPELGTIGTDTPPIVVLTSNRTREVHDALRRRCLYHWVEYPDAGEELRIVLAKVPQVGERLSREIVAFVQALRRDDLYKRPGVAETLDWALALHELDTEILGPETIHRTLGALLKYQDDVEKIRGDRTARLLAEASASLP